MCVCGGGGVRSKKALSETIEMIGNSKIWRK